MFIRFKCSGGYANLSLDYQIDATTLPADLKEELLTLVNQSNVFELQPEHLNTRGTYPDELFYELEVSSDDRHQSLSLNDSSVPVELRPLLTRLQQLAIQSRQRRS